MPTDGPADLVGAGADGNRSQRAGDEGRRRRRRMREEAKSRLELGQLPLLDLKYAPPLKFRRRLDEWLKEPFSCPGSGNAQSVCFCRSVWYLSKAPHVRVLRLESRSQLRIRKYPATPTTTTKTVSVLVPISELSCSTCVPGRGVCSSSAPCGERNGQRLTTELKGERIGIVKCPRLRLCCCLSRTA